MAEYRREQEEQEQEMDIPDISTQELISMQDEDIDNFITELFNENNALPKCEGEQKQSQQILDKTNISLLDMCHYSDISSVEHDNSPSSGQFKENEDENYDEKDDNRDIFYNSCNCIFCSGSSMYR